MIQDQQEALEDSVIRPNFRHSVPIFNCYVLFLNSLVGAGALENSRSFECGILFTTLVHALVALLAYYSQRLLLFVMKYKKTYSYETSWIECGFKAYPMIAIGTFIPCIAFVSYYFTDIKKYFSALLLYHVPKAPEWATDTYVISFILIFTIYIPVYFKQDMSYLVLLSQVAMVTLIGLLCLHIYWMVDYTIKFGFDPRHEVKVAKISNNLFGMVGDFVATYVTYAYLFTSIRHMYNLSYRRAKKLVNMTMITYFVYNELMGLFGYFALYNRVPDNILEALPLSDVSVQIGYVLYVVKLICKIPTSIEPIRVSLLSIVLIGHEYPPFTWATMSIIAMLIAVALSTLMNGFMEIMRCFFNAYVMMMSYVFPGLMAIRLIMKNGLSKSHYAGVVVMFIVGFAFSIYSISSVSNFV